MSTILFHENNKRSHAVGYRVHYFEGIVRLFVPIPRRSVLLLRLSVKRGLHQRGYAITRYFLTLAMRGLDLYLWGVSA
jgi:hypothetical protein